MKVFFPQPVGGNTVVEWTNEEFCLLDNMKKTLVEDLKAHISSKEFTIGYFTPGHSFKGKQVPITSDDDLLKMYSEHRTRRGINLWVKLQGTTQAKRPRSQSGDAVDNGPAPKRSDSTLQRTTDLEEILDQLKSKHQGSHYTPEQLHCWANLIQMKKHDSFDAPPDKPFFGKQRTPNAAVSSPGKRIGLRTQCIDQLTKWHKLREDGVISDEEYREMHKTIMSDIKKF